MGDIKIIEELKRKGTPAYIDCPRSDLPLLFKELFFKKGVEIGISWGQNIVDYKDFEMYGIDPWDADTDEDKFRKVISIPGEYGNTVEGIERLARERTESYPSIHLMKMTSLEALNHFPDRSLDFVYIDGNHSFGYVAMDLMKWNRKVRKGGAIAGHDYGSFNPQTRRQLRAVGNIVDAFAKTYDFENFHVLTGDENWSYLFFKHW